MQDVFEKIKERLEAEVNYQYDKSGESDAEFEKISVSTARISMARCYEYAIEIVNQVAEECKHGHFGCNWNGQHEKCKNCGLRGECSHCNTEWFI